MMLRHPRRAAAIVTVLVACGGCGIKGPLYLPAPPTPATVPPATPTAVPQPAAAATNAPTDDPAPHAPRTPAPPPHQR